MEDPKENLKILKQLGKLENRPALRSPRYHLKVLAKRLAYLHKKKKRFKSKVPGPDFYDEEITAMYWLLAEYQVLADYEVTDVLSQAKGADVINLEKYESILEIVRQKIARKSEKNDGLDEEDSGSED